MFYIGEPPALTAFAVQLIGRSKAAPTRESGRSPAALPDAAEEISPA
jgi:hypothetical protein